MPRHPNAFTAIKEAAQLLNRTRRGVDLLVAEGLLKKATVPGRTQACGITGASLHALLDSMTNDRMTSLATPVSAQARLVAL